MKRSNFWAFIRIPGLSAVVIIGLILSSIVIVVAQDHDMQNMPGMKMSKPKAKVRRKTAAKKRRVTTRKSRTTKKHDMSNMSGMKMPRNEHVGKASPRDGIQEEQSKDTKKSCDPKSDGQHAGNEHACSGVAETIHITTAFVSANAYGYAWNANGESFAVARRTAFSLASNEHEHAWNADATGITFSVAANAYAYARNANAIAFPKPASFPSTKDGHEHADAIGKPISKSDGSHARHGHGWNEHEHGAVDGYERQ